MWPAGLTTICRSGFGGQAAAFEAASAMMGATREDKQTEERDDPTPRRR
jgi:hypothetical protein